jgi:hypothetical protein
VAMKWLLTVVLVAACSGSKGKTVEDARSSQPSEPTRDAAVRVDPSGKGDVQVRVEWKNVPVAARAEPGRTPCKTPRTPAVSPTTTWGIPDVFVSLDAKGAAVERSARVVLADCKLAPRASLTARTLTIASAAMDSPTSVELQQAGQLPLGGTLREEMPRDVFLPIAGHSVEAALDAGAIYRLTAGEEVAWVIASDSPYLGVTEASGTIVLRGVPAGTHAVTAWLPPRSGQSARTARGKVTVTAGALSEVTLDLTTP